MNKKTEFEIMDILDLFCDGGKELCEKLECIHSMDDETECNCDVRECAKALRDYIEMIIFPF